MIGSVIAAAFGVQSTSNRERDFTGSSAKPYIIAGVVFTIIFIAIILAVVKLVLS